MLAKFRPHSLNLIQMLRKEILKVVVAICILVGLAYPFLYFHMQALRRSYCTGIAQQLIRTTNSASLVFVGPGLTSRLSQFLSSPAQVEKVEHGDGGFGDGRAQIFFILINDRGERIGVRLRPAEAPASPQTAGQYHVVGYWTPEPKHAPTP